MPYRRITALCALVLVLVLAPGLALRADTPAPSLPAAGLSPAPGGASLPGGSGTTQTATVTLWDQPLSVLEPNAFANQDFPDYAVYSCYIADDFLVSFPWNISIIRVPGTLNSSASTLNNASMLTWQIYADDNGLPAGAPGVGAAPVWSLSLPPSDAQVTVQNNSTGQLADTLLALSSPVHLQPGRYWFVFFPTLSFSTYGQYFRPPSDTSYGVTAQWRNPGGGFGYGSEWQNWSIVGAASHDAAFTITGTLDVKVYIPLAAR